MEIKHNGETFVLVPISNKVIEPCHQCALDLPCQMWELDQRNDACAGYGKNFVFKRKGQEND